MIITGGKYRSRKLVSPSEKIVKPTLSKVRESVFNILSARMNFDGKSFLDLFSGSCIMGFEAVSRGFTSLVAIDNNSKNVALIKKNAQILGCEGVFLKYDAIKFLQNPKQEFDAIYVDPPYETDLAQRALNLILNKQILAKNGVVIIETLKDKEIDTTGFNIIKETQYGLCKLIFCQIEK